LSQKLGGTKAQKWWGKLCQILIPDVGEWKPLIVFKYSCLMVII